MANEEEENLLSELVDSVKYISGFRDCGNPLYGNLRRKVMMLWPLLVHLAGNQHKSYYGHHKGLNDLTIALNKVMELLESVKYRSKLILAMRPADSICSFHEVRKQIEEALNQILRYDDLGLTKDDYELIEIVHRKFTTDKDKMDSRKFQPLRDLEMMRKKLASITIEYTSNGDTVDEGILIGLSEDLDLTTDLDLDWELSYIAEKQKQIKSRDDRMLLDICEHIVRRIKGTIVMTHESTVIPNHFKCPQSSEMMEDPVIFPTRVTFDRFSFQKWKRRKYQESGGLLDKSSTPNYALRKSIIGYLCNRNAVELSKSNNKLPRIGSKYDRIVISSLLEKFEHEYKFDLWRSMYGNLMRIMRLWSLLFEEFEDNQSKVGGSLEIVRAYWNSAMGVFKSFNDDSRLFQALQFVKTTDKLYEVAMEVEKALDQFYLNKDGLSMDVYEQFKLVQKQVKEPMKSPNLQLQSDLAMVRQGNKPDPEIVGQLFEKLDIVTIHDIKRESIAINLGISTLGYPNDLIDIMSSLLKIIEEYVMFKFPESDMSKWEEGFLTHESRVIPYEFRCPMSLKLMKEPVVVSTGQTYEKLEIQTWLDTGNKTCPKTQQALLHTRLTPNFGLRKAIDSWCNTIVLLIEKLANVDSNEQRSAASELQFLARNVGVRERITNAGAIPPLVKLLQSKDGRTQEQAIAALLNLTVNNATSKAIVMNIALPSIIDVLKSGSTQAKEYAASILCGLLLVDGNKHAIGDAGALPPLLQYLEKGTPRGKFSASSAIYILCLCKKYMFQAIDEGIVTSLKRLLKDAGSTKDKALSILAKLACYQKGKSGIVTYEIMPVVMEYLRGEGTFWNREIALCVLYNFCEGNIFCCSKIIKELRAEVALNVSRSQNTIMILSFD